MFCCGWVRTDFTHFPQGNISDIGTTKRFAGASAILQDMGKCNISQISHYIRQISHNAQFRNRNEYTCTFLLQNGALWDMELVYCEICTTGLLHESYCTDDKTSISSKQKWYVYFMGILYRVTRLPLQIHFPNTVRCRCNADIFSPKSSKYTPHSSPVSLMSPNLN